MSEGKQEQQHHDADDIKGRKSDGTWKKDEGESAEQNAHKSNKDR